MHGNRLIMFETDGFPSNSVFRSRGTEISALDRAKFFARSVDEANPNETKPKLVFIHVSSALERRLGSHQDDCQKIRRTELAK